MPLPRILRQLMLPAAMSLFAGALAAQLPEHLYYKFNEGSGGTLHNDAVPGSGPAVVNIYGGYAWESPGRLGGADLNLGTSGGGAGYVNTGWPTDLRQEWTFELWYRPDIGYIANQDPQILMLDAAAGFQVFIGGAAFDGLIVRMGPIDLRISRSFHVNVADLWTHLAVVYDPAAGMVTGYINSVQAAQILLASPLTLQGGNLQLSHNGRLPFDFDGALDEFRFWAEARSQAEIQAYMNVEIGAGFETYGSGCPGAGGYIPLLHTAGSPRAGARFDLIASNLNSRVPATLILGISDQTLAGGIPLPLDLGPLGAPGCNLYFSSEIIVGSALSSGSGPGTGSVSFTLPIPNDPLYRGAVLYGGYLVVDRVNALDLINTPGGRITIQ